MFIVNNHTDYNKRLLMIINIPSLDPDIFYWKRTRRMHLVGSVFADECGINSAEG